MGRTRDIATILSKSDAANADNHALLNTSSGVDSAEVVTLITAHSTNLDSADLQTISDQVSGNRNLIINGAMEVHQRSSSVASVSDNTYVVQDRMNFFSSNDGVITVTADSTHPTGTGLSKSLKVDVTTADTSIAAGQYLAINQRIEGLNHARLEYGTATARKIVVSFYAKSNLTGPFCYSVKNNASDRSFPIEFSLGAADTWERISFTIPGDTSGTWLETTGLGAYHQIALSMGSTFHGTNNTWQAGNKVATSNQVNLLSNTSNEFFLTGWQVEIGDVATTFEHEDYGTTLAKCKRYYQRYERQANYAGLGLAVPWSTTNGNVPWLLEVQPRSSPTITYNNLNQFDYFGVTGSGSSGNPTAISNGGWAGGNSLDIAFTGSGFTTARAMLFEFNATGSDAFLAFDSEL